LQNLEVLQSVQRALDAPQVVEIQKSHWEEGPKSICLDMMTWNCVYAPHAVADAYHTKERDWNAVIQR
jgi:hypothetical protein